MIAPVTYPFKITSGYGWRTLNGQRQFHDGIDLVSMNCNKVIAISNGVVVYDMDDYEEALRWTDTKHSGGNYLIIRHQFPEAEYFVRYIHLRKNNVTKGTRVNEGDVIGEYADVGQSFGAHLHLDIYGAPTWTPKHNPMEILKEVLKDAK